MKKIFLGILAVVLWTSVGWAAECTGCVESVQTFDNRDSVVSVLVTSDGSACTCTLDNYIDRLEGQHIYSLVVVPGTASVAPDAAFDVDLENAVGFHLVDTDSNSNTTTTWNNGDATLGQFPKVLCATKQTCSGDLVLQMGDMGTAGDQATILIHGMFD